MDVFYSRYYRINTVCLRRIGLWPHDNFFKNKIKQVIVVILIVSILIPQAIRFFEEWNRDIDILIEVIGSLIYFSGSQIKYISFVIVQSKMKFLYEEVSRHWKTLNSESEQNILKKFGEEGRFITLLYLIPINIILAIYITVPLTPVVLDMVDPLNHTRHRMFPYFAEFFIDDQKYYFELTVHCWIVCILSVQIYGTFDTTYAQCVKHAQALFAIVEYRLDRAMKMHIETNDLRERRENDNKVFAETTEAVLLHKQAIYFVDLIEQSYTHVFFWMLVLNTSLLSLAAVDTMLNLEKGNYKQMIRIGTLYIGFSVHLLFNVIPGQALIDSSVKVLDAAIDQFCISFLRHGHTEKLLSILQQAINASTSSRMGELLWKFHALFFAFISYYFAFHAHWFVNSKRTKQLISIMMLRSTKPCSFTAKGLCVLDLETFTFVFKKSISYVTMIGSMR